MNDLDGRVLGETFQERAEAFPVVDFAAERIMRSARRQQRRHRAYGALGGAAAAAVVIALALQSGQVTTAPPDPAATPNPMETSLTIDHAVRANASHAWALSLPPGPREDRHLGYAVERRGERVAVLLERGVALLPAGVRAVSSPMKVGNGWLFVGHRSDRTGEGSVDELGSTVLLVRSDLTVRSLLEAEVVASIFPSPDGQRVGVVTGTVSGHGEIAFDAAHFVTLASGDAVDAALPDAHAAAIATWDGDRVTFVGRVGGLPSSRVHVYDLAQRRWTTEDLRVEGGGSVNLLAAPAAEGGRTSQSFVVVQEADADACVHVMNGAAISPEALVCAPNAFGVLADVSPGARYVVVGQGFTGRVNAGPPARVIEIASGRDAAGVPQQVLDVGAFYLVWENEAALVGRATRATPVHDSATIFRWDLDTSTGESLGWDPTQGPMAIVDSGELTVLLSPTWGGA